MIYLAAYTYTFASSSSHQANFGVVMRGGGDGVTACSRRRLRVHSIFSIANVFKNRF